jgi:glucose-1-phosphate cytidylyltransferase
MKCVILAGGLGTRIGEETSVKPKPMVEIGGMPIIWHIMKCYSAHGITDFIVCLGYKGYAIKEFFSNYFLHSSDVTIDLANNEQFVHESRQEPWKITLVETGIETMTGGRLKAVEHYLDPAEAFCMTYGDGVADIDISALIRYHKSHGGQATVTAVAPPGRFGALEFDADRVTAFVEKPEGDGGLINGGFFVLSPQVLDLIEGPQTVWEKEPLEKLANSGQLFSFKHEGFWQPMDTLRDKQLLEALWQDRAPWKTW